MFGIALWDAPPRTLLLARDRVGIKPLYYAERGGRLYFGSEIKSLLARRRRAARSILDALDHYLSFLYTPRDASIFKGVRKLPPGHLPDAGATALDDRRATGRSAADEAVPAAPRTDAVARCEAVLADAVRSHLVSDVPLGAFLSGGVDSSVVVG